MITVAFNRQGSVETKNVEDATTVGAFLRSQGVSLASNNVRVAAASGVSLRVDTTNQDSYVLNHGDSVSVLPTKQAGALTL